LPVVPASRRPSRQWAEASTAFFREYGCLEIVESWEDFVPDGKQTDFRRAVLARPGEKIVFAWQVWPDKAFLEAAEARMHRDLRMDSAGAPPFDASRLILGAFTPLVAAGRSARPF